jgi:hypothetical protein
MPGITNPSEKYFKDGLWTFDGTVWRPQNQLLAFRDTKQLDGTISDAVAGLNTSNLTAVPAGEVWVITNVIGWNDNHAMTSASIVLVGHEGGVYIDMLASPAAKTALKYAGNVVLRATEYLRFYFYGCTLHDAIVANASGYKFLIAE